jgi:hypothetical protein
VNGDAARAMTLGDQGGSLLVADAREDAGRDLDHGGAHAELGGGGGDFEPDQSPADDQQGSALVQMRLERARLRLGAQVVDALAAHGE